MSTVGEMEPLTSGASNRIIPIIKTLRTPLIFIQSVILYILILLFPRRRQFRTDVVAVDGAASGPQSPAKTARRKSLWRLEEEDTLRRRSLAEGLNMEFETEDGEIQYRWNTSLFFGVRRNALFSRSWLPATGELNCLHSIALLSRLLTACLSWKICSICKATNLLQLWCICNGLDSCGNEKNFIAIGHGGSDGLHGYVPSLDHVVADTGAFLEKIKSENPGVPCFLFGHSTGGAVVLKAASHPRIEGMLEGVVLTSPALRVKPAHPIVGAIAPLFSLVAPKLQFKGANKKGIPVSRDPAALLAKYSDPLVYTGPIRARTGHEILRISSYLMRNFKSVTVPFFVLHGTADKVTDPLASQDFYNEASSAFKDIKLYEGFLHDLLFEPEREEIGQDIINWMEKRLGTIAENIDHIW
ncbi:monoglyceride lipase-like [Gossypium australe]|uniref:Monoglyceride lipase-like n=1 Tax=Gossypium australe TaxID=47621 RepID=A0A5B6U7W9_9ROSI|nr:monoglyceride lipase-like [Gossypium australe]